MKSLIVIGPSGVGKGTIISQLLSKYSIFEFVVSFTTRKPRAGEIHGKDYYFISSEEFNERKDNNEMLENKKVFTNYYGTSAQSYFDIIRRQKIPLLDIDIQGMKDICQKLKNDNQCLPQVLCIMPPSLRVLQQRLSKRGTQDRKVLQQRINQNKEQLNRLMKLNQPNIHFVTNYQYQLTVYGIQLFLASQFQAFHNIYWKNQRYRFK